MKAKHFVTLLLCSWAIHLMAQNLQTFNPRKIGYVSGLTLTEGGTASPFIDTEHTFFGPEEKFVFISSDPSKYLKNLGDIWIISTATGELVKVFDVPYDGEAFSIDVAVRPGKGDKEIAFQIGKREIAILPDWENESKDVFTEKKAQRTDKIMIKAKEDVYSMRYSADGQFLMVEVSTIDLYDANTGQFVRSITPDKKKGNYIGLGNDLILQRLPIKKSYNEKISISHLFNPEIQFEYEAMISGIEPIGDRLNILSCGYGSYELRTGKAIEGYAKVAQSIKDQTGATVKVYDVPNLLMTFVVGYGKTAFFFDMKSFSLVDPGMRLTGMRSGYQISPSGKYFFYSTEEIVGVELWSLY